MTLRGVDLIIHLMVTTNGDKESKDVGTSAAKDTWVTVTLGNDVSLRDKLYMKIKLTSNVLLTASAPRIRDWCGKWR
jgi:2-keto-4-pentenoate hydratase/2-oxohepta-3-ene-1,7-dioic acid hydratase in catechol pathway